MEHVQENNQLHESEIPPQAQDEQKGKQKYGYLDTHAKG